MLSIFNKSYLKRKFIASGFSAVFVAGMFSSCAQAMEELGSEPEPLLTDSKEVKTIDDYFNERKREFLKRLPFAGDESPALFQGRIINKFFPELCFKGKCVKVYIPEDVLNRIYEHFKETNGLKGDSGFDDNIKKKLESQFTEKAIVSWIEWFFPILFKDALGIKEDGEIFYDYDKENGDSDIIFFISKNWEEINSVFPNQEELDGMVRNAYKLSEEDFSKLRSTSPEETKLLEFNTNDEEFDVKKFLARRNFIFQYFKQYALGSMGMDEALRRLSSNEETVDSKCVKETFDLFGLFTDLVENVTGRRVEFTHYDVSELDGASDLRAERSKTRNLGQENVRCRRTSKKVIIYIVLLILVSAIVGVTVHFSVNNGGEQKKNLGDAKPLDDQNNQVEDSQEPADIEREKNQAEQSSSTIAKVSKMVVPVVGGTALSGVALLGKNILDGGISKKGVGLNDIKNLGDSKPDFMFVGPEGSKGAGRSSVKQYKKEESAKEVSAKTSEKIIID